MKMNFNPFASYEKSGLRLNLFDRIVGRPHTMGILDYAFILPSLIKYGLNITKGKSRGLHTIFALLSVPFAIAKFCIYVAGSPVIFCVWIAKNLIQKEVHKHHISPFTAELNKLTVIPVAQPGEDPATIKPVPLSEVIKFHDIDLGKHSIKAVNNEIVLTTYPHNVKLATITSTRKNIIAIKALTDNEEENRFAYFLANVGNHIFDFNVKELVGNINKQQASSHVNMMHALLVNAKVDNLEDVEKSSFGIIHKDVRKMIAKEVLVLEAADINNCNKFFKTFTDEEREEAVLEYISNPKPR